MLEYFPAPSSQPDTRKREIDPKLIRPQQAITESYLQGTENWKLGSAARDRIKKRRRPAWLEEQRTETAATARTGTVTREEDGGGGACAVAAEELGGRR